VLSEQQQRIEFLWYVFIDAALPRVEVSVGIGGSVTEELLSQITSIRERKPVLQVPAIDHVPYLVGFHSVSPQLPPIAPPPA
jgi:hypothetical protein